MTKVWSVMLKRNQRDISTDQGAQSLVDTSQRFGKVFFGRSVVVFGFCVVVLSIIAAIFAPLITPYDPIAQNLDNVMAKPSLEHWLGTDTVGRDTLSRIIYGSRTSLTVGIVALGLAATIGMALGLVAGYFGGIVHAVIMRCMDALMTVPMILLALTVSAVLGGGLKNVIIALGVALVPTYARLMCGQAMTIKQNDYVLAQRSLGAGNLRTMLRHVAPNCFPPLIVMMTMQIGITILAEAGLSFLGIGVNPPTAAWGAMVSEGYRFLTINPLLSFAPGLAIMLVVFAFNMIGDGLRDALDPRLRGTL
jgi:peptide/nickel transport system permease protein